ncbi:uncharacterized protein LOC142177270 [Nicotiana tabacum]|uniref:Uncharacterized protein LOC142177270 n=1 Tax=Nicotiana tabacum TaxID=4097 RepID=A0AC58TX75_TOBAC
MVEGTRLKLMDDKLARHDELLADVLNNQEEFQNTQTGIQVEVWYHSLLLSKGVLTWAEFNKELVSRFGVVLDEDVVEEFNKLSQKGTVDEFLGKFEDRKAQMLVRNPQLNESHFLSSFIGALKEEIKFGIKLFKPETLKNLPANRTTAFRLSPEVYEHKKNNRLCYICGEKYAPDHQCKRRQLNCLKGEVEAEAQLDEFEITEVPIPPDLIIEGGVEQEIQEAIYMNALSGNNQGENTILIGETVKKRHITVIIDSGSTHSFIDEHTVKETGYQASFCPPVRVTVADGNYVMCTTHCKGFIWKMHGRSFQEDLLIIPLGGCDLVLGNNWMKKHNPIKFDHEKKCVTIGRKNNKLVLHGITEEGRLNMMTSRSMCKEHTDEAIQEVLSQYADVFAETKSLPPVRALDHAIHLKPGSYHLNLEDHVKHLMVVFDILREHALFAKKSKCSFGQAQVEYLGHVIKKEGVSTDPNKIQAMVDWTRPSSLRALKGFLGLTGYYRKYVANYGTICRPLTDFLKKDVFKWNPRLNWPFQLSIRTDHHGLKYLLEQKVTSAIQQKGLTKLLGLDYEVQYKKGAENKVADALSRQREGLDNQPSQEFRAAFSHQCFHSHFDA